MSMDLVAPQLAQLQTHPPTGSEWVHEIKFDGYRTLAYFEKNGVTMRTRGGLNWTSKYSWIAKALEKLKLNDTILDGEIVWLDDDGRSDFQRLQNALKRGASNELVYYVFDILEYKGRDLREEPQLERKKILEKILARKSTPDTIRYAQHWKDDPSRLLSASCRMGLEGLISKKVDATYESGRNRNWIKSKCTKAQEFVIGGYTEAEGSNIGFRSLLLGAYDGSGKFTYVGRVGTGFSQSSILELIAQFRKLKQSKSPFDVGSPRARGVHFLKPVLVAQINFAEWTEDGSLRHPSFQGLREDKPAKLVRFETRRKAARAT